jgi:amino acid adenylation domain-containing protein
MSNAISRLKDLSPEQRDLLLRRLAKANRKGREPAGKLIPRAQDGQQGDPAESPLSFAQERQWFLDRLSPGDPIYNIPGALRLTGALSLPALSAAFDTILRRHDVLRANFVAPAGKPVQVIAPPSSLPIAIVDLTGCDPASQREQCRTLYDAEIRRGFDLASDLLVRVTLIRLAAEEHLMIFCMHHIVSDGWSVGVFLEEMRRLYVAAVTSREADLPDLPVQYGDFAEWQRGRLQDGVLETGLAYWRKQLENPPPVLELPPDRLLHGDAPPTETDLAGTECVLVIGEELKQALDDLSRREESTLFVTLLTAFMTLLMRATGQGDVVVGSPVSGRIRVETEALIGLFLNTLALRAKLSGDITFRQAIALVRASFLDGLEHHEVPFERVVQDLDPERTLSGHPLFEILFNFTPNPPRTMDLGGLRGSFEAPTPMRTQFSMTLFVLEWEGRLELRLHYKRELYSERRMVLLLEQFEEILRQAVADPDRQLGQLDLRTAGSVDILPDPTARLDRPEQEPVVRSIARWAERTPDRPAVTRGGIALTYAQFAARMTGLAEGLCAAGLRPGEVVAVLGPRCPGFIVAMAAVLRAGGVLLTLSLDLPVQRRRLMLEQAGARVLLHAGPLRDEDGPLLELPGLTVLPVEADGGPAAPVTTELPEPTAGTGDPAYIFFTSGSTGVPKAVHGVHGGLAHFLSWQRETFQVGPGDRCAQLTGLSFDVVLRDVFLPLTSGAEMVLPGDADGIAGGRTPHWLEEQRITLLHTVPSVADTWLLDRGPGVTLASLKRVFFAGEPLTASLIERWRRMFPLSGKIVNLYGPTETTLAKCFHRVPPHPRAGVQPLGTPLPQTQLLVLTPDRRQCGIGEPGEIAVRTPFRSLGYLNAADESAKRFILNPFVPNPAGADPEDRLYLTGDRGVFGADGLLEFLGRMDHQVKVRGVRVEPMEVQATLGSCPEVAACAVVARTDGPDGAVLVAYVVPEAGADRNVQRLRDYLRQRLPAPMIPSAFVFLDKLPLTANHKLDRDRLPPPRDTPSALESIRIAPRDPVELRIAQIWLDMLNIRDVGVTDNFFEVGGHSLLSLRLLVKIEQALGCKVPLSALFEAPTIEHLANVARRQETATSPVVKLWSADHPRKLFLVHTGGGTVLNYVALVRNLAPEVPVYAMQALGLDGQDEPHRNIPAMAADYVDKLRTLQPEGPYLLGGHSFGGVIAYEMASQLVQAGQEVALLALFDTALPQAGAVQDAAETEAQANARALADAAAVFERFTGQGIDVSYEALCNLSPNDQIALVTSAIDRSGGARLAEGKDLGGEELIRNLLAVDQAHREARRSYSPPASPVPVILFRATDAAHTPDEPSGWDAESRQSLGWSRVSKAPVQVVRVPGDHVTMMNDHNAGFLAESLRPHLSAAIRRA